MNTDPAQANVFNVFDATQANFEAEVLQASLDTPILVDFWAAWCGPCKILGPMLEKLAEDYHGSFRLAKVDVDQNRELAAMFGIRSVPTVVLVKDGQLLDGFSGALPESELRAFLDKHVEPRTTADEAAPAAVASPVERVAELRAALAAEPARDELKLELAEALLRQGETAEIESLLDTLPANLAVDPRLDRIRGGLELSEALRAAPAEAQLRQQLETDAQDWSAHDLLALHRYFDGAPAEAFEQWLSILKSARDWNEGLAKKRLLAAFAISDDAELVGRYRRQLSSLLF